MRWDGVKLFWSEKMRRREEWKVMCDLNIPMKILPGAVAPVVGSAIAFL